MDTEEFGITASGEPVRRFTLSAGDLTARIMTFGAAIQDLRLAGHDAPLVLGFDRFEDYPAHSPYFGAIAGRYANRVRDGRFMLDGNRYAIDPAHPEKHGLHGGSDSYAHRNWTVEDHSAAHLTVRLHDADTRMGFPGNLDVTCTYRLAAPGTLSVELSAVTDQPTLCNLAQHSYFNLDDGGSGDILDHRMMIGAAAYLPVDAELIPTGLVQPVDETAFDFRQARPIRFEEDGQLLAYDHNFCLAASRGPLSQAVWVHGAYSGVEMEVWTTEPGVQFYSGVFLPPPVPGLEGRSYRQFGGFCLEPQVWPDSPNRPYYPQAVLRPGDVYRQRTEYRFRSGS